MSGSVTSTANTPPVAPAPPRLQDVLPRGATQGAQCDVTSTVDGRISDINRTQNPQTGLETVSFHARTKRGGDAAPIFFVEIAERQDTDGSVTRVKGQIYLHATVTRNGEKYLETNAQMRVAAPGQAMIREITQPGQPGAFTELKGDTFSVYSHRIPIPFTDSVTGTISCHQ